MFIFGYIDPGTGSLFLQVILGVLLGGIVFFRQFIKKIVFKMKALFGRNTDSTKKNEDE